MLSIYVSCARTLKYRIVKERIGDLFGFLSQRIRVAIVRQGVGACTFGLCCTCVICHGSLATCLV